MNGVRGGGRGRVERPLPCIFPAPPPAGLPFALLCHVSFGNFCAWPNWPMGRLPALELTQPGDRPVSSLSTVERVCVWCGAPCGGGEGREEMKKETRSFPSSCLIQGEAAQESGHRETEGEGRCRKRGLGGLCGAQGTRAKESLSSPDAGCRASVDGPSRPSSG